MLRWGDFRTVVRRSIVNDQTETTFTDEQLLDALGWALETFSAHTAVATGVEITGNPLPRKFTLPENLYNDLEFTGFVYLQSETELKPVFPATSLDRDVDDLYYNVWGNELILSAQPKVTYTTLIIRYFAYYNVPVTDNDLITVPRWARAAVATLTGAFALTKDAVGSASIDRWKERTDAGQPENNALRVQQQHMFKVYEQEIARQPRQIRDNNTLRLI